jgi:hypothetical protein
MSSPRGALTVYFDLVRRTTEETATRLATEVPGYREVSQERFAF